MKILDNFLPSRLHFDLVNLIRDTQFNWTYTPNTYGNLSSGVVGSNVTESQQFVHILYKHQPNIVSSVFTLFRPLVYFCPFEYKDLDRMKVNLLCKDSSYPKDHYHTPHADSPKGDTYKTLLYYVNTSDGDTLFFDDNGNETDRVTPKSNRAVIFDSTIMHASSSPRKTDTRIVINTVFKI